MTAGVLVLFEVVQAVLGAASGGLGQGGGAGSAIDGAMGSLTTSRVAGTSSEKRPHGSGEEVAAGPWR